MSWINANGFIPNDGLNGPAAPWANNAGGAGPFPAGSPGYFGYGPAASDAVRPAWFGGANDGSGTVGQLGTTLSGGVMNPGANGGIGGILAQLASQVQQSIAQLSSALMGTSPASGATSSASPASFPGTASFANVSLASTGDPHLSVSGTEQNADGSTTAVNSKFDSMSGHDDLFSTRAFGDGFHVSTAVTAPSANGITQNAAATATMDGGRESVTLTNGGTLSVTDHGQAVAIAPGQSVTLSGSQQVSEAANGSVSINESSANGSLSTTFAQNGTGGVDVTAQGRNVTLAGDLITGGTTPVAQPPNARLPYEYV